MKLPCIYPILDTQCFERRQFPIERAAAAIIEGGAGILQFRHKGHWTRAIFEQADKVARLCREGGCLPIVDDRADMALLLETGLHLGQDDLLPRDARKLLGTAPEIGYSTHNDKQLSAAGGEPVNYVALGPIFATGSKDNPDPVVGLEQLRLWRALVEQPLVAIGGITRANAQSVFDAGADSVAVMADLLPDELSAITLRKRMEEWRQLTRR